MVLCVSTWPNFVLIWNRTEVCCFILGLPLRVNSRVDFPQPLSNNPPMPRPDAVRRVKSYSAADGYVYQYYFFEGNRAQRDGRPGGEFTYVISADRRSTFPFKIFVRQSALDAWAKQNGRSLTSSEEYAVAKMRLFQAFDEGSVQAPPEGQQAREVVVDESNLEDLLGKLGI
ncbi:MAG: hypothetical protein DMG50_06125 [Acidobacteria bacterium]|nr:MAG: hypothetical protein DMG50_06125 [Acidobacteriota bacterium]